MTEPHSFLMRCWAEAWAISRNAALPVPRDGALYTHVGEPGHLGRYLFVKLDSEAIVSLARRIDRPTVQIKVCSNGAAVLPLLPPGWALDDPHVMMTAPLAVMIDRPAPIPDGFTLTIERRGPIFAIIRDARGIEAAWGRIIVRQGIAMFDRIATDDAYRRRGLGSAVMRALAVEAAEGAREAVLCATPDGQALYGALGWSVQCDYTTAGLATTARPASR